MEIYALGINLVGKVRTMNLRSVITSIGKNIKPYYPVAGVAAAEFIFRPMFTMMDKKTPSETKKYTALREAITEVVAAPIYIALPVLASKGSLLIKDAEKAKRASHNLQVLGVWTAALLVIPGLCSLFVKPFTEKIFNKNTNKNNSDNDEGMLDVTSEADNLSPMKMPLSQTGNINYYAVKNLNFSSFVNSGMRVG